MLKKTFVTFLTVLITFVLLSSGICADIPDDVIFEMYFDAQKENEATFSDLDSVPWAVTPITELSKRGIVAGMGNGIFAPQSSVSRTEFIKLITATCGLVNPDAQGSYPDVTKDHWSYAYVCSAKSIGLTDIYPETGLAPNEPISREDICYISAKAINICVGTPPDKVQLSNAFSDEAEMSSYAVAPVYQLTKLGIINGRGDGTFSPKAPATRAESAKIIYNVLKIIEENY